MRAQKAELGSRGQLVVDADGSLIGTYPLGKTAALRDGDHDLVREAQRLDLGRHPMDSPSCPL